MSAVDPVQAAIQAAIAKAAAQSNHGEATKGGGGDMEPAKPGLTILTLVSYIEIGKQLHEIPNKPSWESDDVLLVFEMNGGANKAKEVEGKLYPKRVEVQEKLSQNEKANYLKIFNQLNYDGQATHGSQLVGKHFLANVFVNDKGYPSLKGPNGYNFQAPIVIKGDPLDPEQQTKHPVPAPARSDSTNRVFLWDYACQEMWDSIFIDGEYEARKDEKTGKEYPAKSKNKFQILIKKALNFQGSPIQKILGEEALSLSDSPIGGDDALSGTAEQESVATQSQSESEASASAAADPLDGLL
ncbi:hypothetical protein SKa3_00019 [Pseudomonas phage vB_PpuP-SKa-3]